MAWKIVNILYNPGEFNLELFSVKTKPKPLFNDSVSSVWNGLVLNFSVLHFQIFLMDASTFFLKFCFKYFLFFPKIQKWMKSNKIEWKEELLLTGTVYFQQIQFMLFDKVFPLSRNSANPFRKKGAYHQIICS